MAGPDKPRATVPRRSPNTSSVQSRAAKRRVDLGESTTPPPAARPPAGPRPWWRRGGFWFLVIVAEVLAALVISYNTPSAKEDVNLEGGDLVEFCVRVQGIVRQANRDSSIDVGELADTFQHEADAYRRLSEVAPTDLVPDLQKLADLRTQLVVATKDVYAKQIADPRNYNSALADVAKAQADIESKGIDANDKVNRYVLRGCNIDLSSPTPVSVGPGTSTTAPATSGSTPGSASAGTTPGSTPSK